MQIVSDCLYRASELQKIVNLILGKLNSFLYTCRLMDVDIMIFYEHRLVLVSADGRSLTLTNSSSKGLTEWLFYSCRRRQRECHLICSRRVSDLTYLEIFAGAALLCSCPSLGGQ